MSTTKPRVLIEDWLPVRELGIESRRERKVFTDLPPLSYLHIWWARRPIVASQAVALASLLPSWSSQLATIFSEQPTLASEGAYHDWLLRLVGILGDPVKGALREAQKIATGKEAFGYAQAWKNSPNRDDVDLLHAVLQHTWGCLPSVADPTAGGGTIPFAAARYGLPVVANDLNSVAASVMLGGVKYASDFSASVSETASAYAEILARRLDRRLKDYFEVSTQEEIVAYLYTYEITCPRTGKPFPLLPNLYLDRAGEKTAVAIRLTDQGYYFQVVSGKDIDFDPAIGTFRNGRAVSPHDDLIVEDQYIKGEAKAKRLLPVLYAVAWRSRPIRGRRAGPLTFRSPTPTDKSCVENAATAVDASRARWVAEGLLPDEELPPPIPKHDIRPYGFAQWCDFFSPRQLLTHVTFLEEYRSLAPEVQRDAGDQSEVILNLISLMHGKMLDYNSRMSVWNLNQHSVQHGFESHAFAFRSAFAEKMLPGNLLRWASTQVCKAFRVSSELMHYTRGNNNTPSVTVTRGNAADIDILADGSIPCIIIDPPYYDNVMYGELSDFFYVWHRRSFGVVRPDLFPGLLADQENEAVANIARFAVMGKRRIELAELDYETKMTAIFGECRRILQDSGVMTVMFTHKRAEAWDTLGMGLIQAGFTIETSWPVNTEFEFSPHQAEVNSAASTIMLVCRKRNDEELKNRIFLDDIEEDIRAAARNAAIRFQHDGIEGVDLLLSTYGPTLSVISRNWPVYSSTPDESGREKLLRPEEALDIAREEVVRLRRARLIGKAAQIDDYTDFVLLAWDIFAAREFPFDTARLLALAVGGLDIDVLAQAKIVKKGSGFVRLLEPHDRLRRDPDNNPTGVKPDASHFDYVIDAVDTALYIAEQDGMPAAKRFIDRLGLTADAAFVATVQGLVNAIPRTKSKGQWVVPEAGLLDTLATLYLPTIEFPPTAPDLQAAKQDGLF